MVLFFARKSKCKKKISLKSFKFGAGKFQRNVFAILVSVTNTSWCMKQTISILLTCFTCLICLVFKIEKLTKLGR